MDTSSPPPHSGSQERRPATPPSPRGECRQDLPQPRSAAPSTPEPRRFIPPYSPSATGATTGADSPRSEFDTPSPTLEQLATTPIEKTKISPMYIFDKTPSWLTPTREEVEARASEISRVLSAGALFPLMGLLSLEQSRSPSPAELGVGALEPLPSRSLADMEVDSEGCGGAPATHVPLSSSASLAVLGAAFEYRAKPAAPSPNVGDTRAAAALRLPPVGPRITLQSLSAANVAIRTFLFLFGKVRPVSFRTGDGDLCGSNCPWICLTDFLDASEESKPADVAAQAMVGLLEAIGVTEEQFPDASIVVSKLLDALEQAVCRSAHLPGEALRSFFIPTLRWVGLCGHVFGKAVGNHQDLHQLMDGIFIRVDPRSQTVQSAMEGRGQEPADCGRETCETAFSVPRPKLLVPSRFFVVKIVRKLSGANGASAATLVADQVDIREERYRLMAVTNVEAGTERWSADVKSDDGTWVTFDDAQGRERVLSTSESYPGRWSSTAQLLWYERMEQPRAERAGVVASSAALPAEDGGEDEEGHSMENLEPAGNAAETDSDVSRGDTSEDSDGDEEDSDEIGSEDSWSDVSSDSSN
ncbi:hypothetical protein HMN09_00158500 [Mycena chlorophos]|uniref:USP domain-containing protein n=1 Tax=Mycena chlorophos TaxID=658473 RepID=A0A8H6TQ23_MYCCL|nr:hypothetical protein HMN09_00158500 [Mycena chlorophos]